MEVKIIVFISGILETLNLKNKKLEFINVVYKLFKFHLMINIYIVQDMIKNQLLRNGIYKVHSKKN